MHGPKPTLVLGGTGKTGRRVVERLTARGLPVRIGSRLRFRPETRPSRSSTPTTSPTSRSRR
jgi:uncharacterized protein YbjT (DUF2867 family)